MRNLIDLFYDFIVVNFKIKINNINLFAIVLATINIAVFATIVIVTTFKLSC